MRVKTVREEEEVDKEMAVNLKIVREEETEITKMKIWLLINDGLINDKMDVLVIVIKKMNDTKL